MDHCKMVNDKMVNGKMNHAAKGAKDGKASAWMDCCKDGCASCANDRPAS